MLAAERGAARLELAGEARSLDAYHLTAPDPDGAGAERAMRGALADAGEVGRRLRAGARNIDAAQRRGRGSGAPAGRSVGRSSEAHVSSIKGALGHAIAGAGALGFLAACAAILDGVRVADGGSA